MNNGCATLEKAARVTPLFSAKDNCASNVFRPCATRELMDVYFSLVSEPHGALDLRAEFAENDPRGGVDATTPRHINR
jgi:hypothetical protein